MFLQGTVEVAEDIGWPMYWSPPIVRNGDAGEGGAQPGEGLLLREDANGGPPPSDGLGGKGVDVQVAHLSLDGEQRRRRGSTPKDTDEHLAIREGAREGTTCSKLPSFYDLRREGR